MSLASSCSAAISVACHPAPEEVDTSTMPAQWGSVMHGGNGAKGDENVGHRGFRVSRSRYPFLGDYMCREDIHHALVHFSFFAQLSCRASSFNQLFNASKPPLDHATERRNIWRRRIVQLSSTYKARSCNRVVIKQRISDHWLAIPIYASQVLGNIDVGRITPMILENHPKRRMD
ncbi:hypothetical protein K469DRAFT_805235 [Zopfia rhizophila CBS 207.26]|uniref:Uncharacterized protein n=1 Tax=Zopfia rhizophila CBS 207.26 TaxID=1314779 RepID=A0A6A6EPC7_9PEZI|nr:hypothetical protein K469DRAFT_805235 [Zopfia rhizophila CBS 207.26]